MPEHEGHEHPVIDAFWRYERALMANDLVELDALFAPGESTVRGDANGILVGHDAISAFRQGRGGAPARSILHVEARELAADVALVIAITEPATGGRGQQTQVWRRLDGEWRVEAAHVATPAQAIAASTWRVTGAPLVAGSAAGPLAGLSVAVKDLFAVRGFAIGGGVPAFLAERHPETVTASAVQSLLDAGASVTGIAQTDEFAYSIAGRNPHYGTPPNPAVVGGIPGGSSSGPASAVAQGQASIGLGTDTGGSIRVPASYLGLWGLRTTHGAVPADGLLPLAPSFDTIGWLTRDAATLARAARVSVDESRTRGLDSPARFAVSHSVMALLEPEVRTAFHHGLGLLERGGLASRHDLDHVDLGDLDELFETFRTVQAAEAWATHGAWVGAHPGAIGAEIAARFAFASTITPDAEARGRERLAAARDRLHAVLGDRILVLPSASSIAPSATADAETIERTRAATLRLTCIAGLTGRPALSAPLLSAPLAWQRTGAPIGLCFVGPRGSDAALVDFVAPLAHAR